MKILRIAGVVFESYVDGPGVRYTIFTQGCNHKCPGCQNPDTWSFEDGQGVNIDLIFDNIMENPLIDGVTFSGGDPFYQSEVCTKLAKRIKSETNLNIWAYTGFTYEEIIKDTNMLEFLKTIDVLVDGMYIEGKRSLEIKFRGSTNQRIIDVKKSLENEEIMIIDI